jgi:hypothetical protein
MPCPAHRIRADACNAFRIHGSLSALFRVKTPIFFCEAVQGADVGNGKKGNQVCVCKDTLFARPPASEK